MHWQYPCSNLYCFTLLLCIRCVSQGDGELSGPVVSQVAASRQSAPAHLHRRSYYRRKMPRAAKEKPEKKEKKVKDPNAPKKPMGAYMWFCKEMREQVKADNPEFSVTDIGRRLGELWKECEDDDKKKFQDLADKDKERYNKENAAYQKKEKEAKSE